MAGCSCRVMYIDCRAMYKQDVKTVINKFLLLCVYIYYMCMYIYICVYVYLSYAEVVSETVVPPPSGVGQCYPSGLASTRHLVVCVRVMI